MKIIHVIPNLRKGGAERIVLNICNEIHSRQEHDVLLITFEQDNSYEFLTRNINWKVVVSDVIPSISGKATINISELQKTIEDFQPDIIHAHLFKSIIVISQIHYDKAHYVIHFHDNMHQLENFSVGRITKKSAWTNYYEKRMVLKSFRKKRLSVITISDETERFARKVLSNSIPVYKLHNAIDYDRFFSEVRNRNEGQIVMIGSFVPKKNQLLAIQAIQELDSRGHKVVLNLVGDGPLKSNLEKYSQENGISHLVNFLGVVDYPEKVLSEASIYLHTAIIEPFGLVLLEAMAAGLPVVCTNGGGNSDLIVEGENGFMINEFSPELLAYKVEFLWKNADKRMEMGRKAQEYSRQFDMKSYVDRLIQLYSIS